MPGGGSSYFYAEANDGNGYEGFWQLAYDGSACTGGDVITTIDFYYHIDMEYPVLTTEGGLRVRASASYSNTISTYTPIVWHWNHGNSWGNGEYLNTGWRLATAVVNAPAFRFEYERVADTTYNYMQGSSNYNNQQNFESDVAVADVVVRCGSPE